MSVYRETIPTNPEHQHLLGRHIEHDEQSLAFALPKRVDRSTWHSKFNRVIDPRPNPNQPVGNCTMCSSAMQHNTMGNRVLHRVLDMEWALNGYVWETHNDEFRGAYNRDGSGQDTGSSDLSACKTTQHLGVGGSYHAVLGGADELIQLLMDGKTIKVGTNWYNDMFEASDGTAFGLPIVRPTGGLAGGHSWLLRGYHHERQLALGRCWWGDWRDFWMRIPTLDSLKRDKGDAYWQQTVSGLTIPR